ncbi:MAG: phosphoglycerate kinase [Chromatiales bacterium]|nr:phosphoglycerate kinase [Chromatiales bacterium]
MALRTLEQVPLANKRVMMRVDMNVPLHNGVVSDDLRIRANLPDIRTALEAPAALMLVSHLGRPEAGQVDSAFSLQPVADRLSELLDKAVPVVTDYLSGVAVEPGELVMCENIRFQAGELSDDDQLATGLAELCDVYVMNAFGCAHRAHASTHQALAHAKVACVGTLFAQEIAEISNLLDNDAADYSPDLRRVAIVGGAKIAGKLELLSVLSEKVDTLIIGGGIANTFIAAMGYDIGQSLYEKELISFAIDLQDRMTAKNKQLLLPSDVICAKELSQHAHTVCKAIDNIEKDEMILDIGVKTQATYADAIAAADLILWNGPPGAFEYTPFAAGTGAVADAIQKTNAHIVVGGGDTSAAIKKFELQHDNMYISTGGGAFLQFVSGQALPTLTMLESKMQNNQSDAAEN